MRTLTWMDLNLLSRVAFTMAYRQLSDIYIRRSVEMAKDRTNKVPVGLT